MVEADLRSAISKFKKNTNGVAKHDATTKLLNDVLERMDTVGRREARKAHLSRARFRTGTTKKPAPKRITEQPVPTGQLPGKVKEFGD